MEQPKEKIGMIRPEEWADTHLEAHNKLNAAITQFYGLFEDVIKEINSMKKKQEDAEEKNFASFSKLKDSINELKKDIESLNKAIEQVNNRLDQWRKFITKNYEWILDTDKDTVVELDSITDLVWDYLVNIVVNEEAINQWVKSYSFPKTSLSNWEYTPRLSLSAKDWEHAVLEYSFTVILTQL